MRTLQTISRADTATLLAGTCPACNQNHFLLSPSHYHHEEASFRRLLCISCFREFGVAPHRWARGSEPVDDTPIAIVLHYVLSPRRLNTDYNIITGSAPQINTQLQLGELNANAVCPSRAAAAGITAGLVLGSMDGNCER